MITIGVNPVAITLGSLSIWWYGIMVALAILVLILWMAWQIRRGAEFSYETVFTAALIGIPSGIIFAKLIHVIDKWGYYSQHPAQIASGAGLTIYGAILGAFLGIWVYSRVSRFRFGYFIDLLAPGIILAQAIGRVGCTLNGCCYGLPTSLPWGVIYTHPNSHAPLGVAVHPTQIYEIIFCLVVFGVLLMLRGRLKPEGSLFGVYISLYAAWRIGVGFLRDGSPFLFGLHEAQVISIAILLITIPLMAVKTRWVSIKD